MPLCPGLLGSNKETTNSIIQRYSKSHPSRPGAWSLVGRQLYSSLAWWPVAASGDMSCRWKRVSPSFLTTCQHVRTNGMFLRMCHVCHVWQCSQTFEWHVHLPPAPTQLRSDPKNRSFSGQPRVGECWSCHIAINRWLMIGPKGDAFKVQHPCKFFVFWKKLWVDRSPRNTKLLSHGWRQSWRLWGVAVFSLCVPFLAQRWTGRRRWNREGPCWTDRPGAWQSQDVFSTSLPCLDMFTDETANLKPFFRPKYVYSPTSVSKSAGIGWCKACTWQRLWIETLGWHWSLLTSNVCHFHSLGSSQAFELMHAESASRVPSLLALGRKGKSRAKDDWQLSLELLLQRHQVGLSSHSAFVDVPLRVLWLGIPLYIYKLQYVSTSLTN